MAQTLEIYDGSTTLDLLDGSNYQARNLVFSLSPKQQSLSGTELRRIVFLPREINIPLNFIGTTVADLVVNVRALTNMLRTAEQRQIQGHGTKVILQYQEGDTDADDITQEIVAGQIVLPSDAFWDVKVKQFFITDATLVLTLEPFGRLDDVSPTPGTLENEQDGASLNYMDIDSVAGTSGGLLELKIHDTNLGDGDAWAGTTKMWIAKRSGERKADALFLAAPDSVTEVTDPSTANDLTPTMTTTGGTTTNASGGAAALMKQANATGSSTIITDGFQNIAYAQYDISTLPLGRYRVLCRFTVDNINGGTSNTTVDKEDHGIALGYVFGGKTVTPVSGDEVNFDAAWTETEYHTVDVGELIIPPIGVPGGSGTDPTLNLRIYWSTNTESTENVGHGTPDGSIEASIDYVFLLPVDEGVVIVDAIDTNDRILITNKEDVPGVWLLNSSDVVQSVATFNGGPFNVGPEDTRIFVLRDDVGDPTVTEFTVTPIYTPLIQGV